MWEIGLIYRNLPLVCDGLILKVRSSFGLEIAVSPVGFFMVANGSVILYNVTSLLPVIRSK
jgi:uncharacterized membrane protein